MIAHGIPIQKTTIDMATNCVEKTETVAAQVVTSVRPGCCEACGMKHAPDEPHNLRNFWVTELTARGEMAGGENG
ncbi:hypothetical protein [Serratia silvae]|uniref:Transposase n=1 Tax=Serratia silvae TaxID=2824122 RepID=A0ABT0KHC8_9GAMM|nr:hypothetical protein [Serratia silvae]MCL1031336.1 hypothetical protein [Serratia silvae]